MQVGWGYVLGGHWEVLEGSTNQNVHCKRAVAGVTPRASFWKPPRSEYRMGVTMYLKTKTDPFNAFVFGITIAKDKKTQQYLF